MPDPGVEHQTEVRRTGRHPLVWAAVAGLVALVVALVVAGGGDGGDAEEAAPAQPSSTPTSETLTTTSPPPDPEVLAVADAGGGPVPASTAQPDLDPSPPARATYEILQAPPIATDGRVVVLVDGGRLLVGEPGAIFRSVGLEAPVSQIVASNEPGHVWARVSEDQLALVPLDGGEPTERIDVGTDRLLGPASFGVVTVDDDGTISWRRPRFDATSVPIPADRTPVDAGGDLVLTERPTADGRIAYERWSVVDGTLVEATTVDDVDRAAVLAPDGSAALLPHPDGWRAYQRGSPDPVGALPAAPGVPVWIGAERFAIVVDGRIVVSHGPDLGRPWAVVALAERSP